MTTSTLTDLAAAEQATRRPATPDDPPCSCGLPARVVYLTDKFGEVPSCR